MSKRLQFIGAVALAAFAFAADAKCPRDWTSVATKERGRQVCMNLKSVGTEGPWRKVQTMSSWSSPQKNEAFQFRSVVHMGLFDCSNGKVAIGAMEYFAGPIGTGDSVRTITFDRSNMPEEDNFPKSLLVRVCNAQMVPS